MSDDCAQDRRDLWDAINRERDARAKADAIQLQILTELKGMREALEDRNGRMDERCDERKSRLEALERRQETQATQIAALKDTCALLDKKILRVALTSAAVGAALASGGTAAALKLIGLLVGVGG
jgi:chromosome segregation ATPase